MVRVGVPDECSRPSLPRQHEDLARAPDAEEIDLARVSREWHILTVRASHSLLGLIASMLALMLLGSLSLGMVGRSVAMLAQGRVALSRPLVAFPGWPRQPGPQT